MAFKHGSEAQVLANGYDLTSYLRSFSSPLNVDVADATTFGKTAKVYKPGLADAQFSAEGFFDGAADAVDEILASVVRQNDVIWNWYPQGGAVGNKGYGFSTVETSYEIETPIDGVGAITVEGQSSVARERVTVLHALGEESASGTGTIIDNGEETSNGAVGYLHVTGVTGSVTVEIEHSSDNFAADIVTLLTFTSVNADHQAECIEVSGTVKRYVRAKWTIDTGPATFHVALGRK